MKFLIYLLFFVFTINLFSNEILISKVNQDSNILDKTDFYIDIDSKKSFEDIKSNPNIFKAYKDDFINQGFTTNTIWLKFSIKNDTNKKISKFLELDNTMIDEIILYENFRNNKYIKKKTGVMHREEFHSFMRYKFEIDLNIGEEKSIS